MDLENEDYRPPWGSKTHTPQTYKYEFTQEHIHEPEMTYTHTHAHKHTHTPTIHPHLIFSHLVVCVKLIIERIFHFSTQPLVFHTGLSLLLVFPH